MPLSSTPFTYLFLSRATAAKVKLQSHCRFALRPCRIVSPVNDNHDTFPAGAEAVTFVGHPFPLDEAPQHLARLCRWGFTFGE
jgi:hypothetical protein